MPAQKKAPAKKTVSKKKQAKPAKESKAMKTLKRCRAEVSGKRSYFTSAYMAQAKNKQNKKRRSGTDIQSSVIRLFASHSQPNYSQPWCSDAQTSSTSTAWPIRMGRGQLRLVTNAHSVEHATLVQVKRHQQEKKYVAKVLCIGPDCDLALLEVPDAGFWKGLAPLEISAQLPQLQDEVRVLGYPTGGENLSVTQGVVSRVDLVEYAQSGVVLLGVQIDAAINSGNSGGPVVDKHGNCIGVAFQNLSDDEEGTENIGYVIPSEVLLHFLEDYSRHKCFTGFGSAGFEFQPLESPVLRLALGLKGTMSGVRVKAVDKAGPSHGLILPEDVLLRVEDYQVGNDGSVAFARGRIPFPYLIQSKFKGDKINMQVLRDGKKVNVTIFSRRGRNLVDADAGGPHASAGCVAPRYLISGGLIFVPLTRPFLASAFGENFECERPAELSSDLLNLLENGTRDCSGHELIVLTQVLASEVTIGYSDAGLEVLESFNGVKVKNLKHLSELLDKCKDKFMRFGFQGKHVVILDAAQARKGEKGILQQNMIPAARSRIL
eukprot:TRINITY_DN27332_c0_g1_i1.p1 TRINITY_DN27332_c0_g1~~TRINITY_DN27332_c0_g1_i1.p1  ORF type:complete len:547 (-),score=110.05 TRINITY_DN27332_c0_g1_i1:197-1837(-)